MQLERDSIHFAILDALCSMPRAVQGITLPMLERRFGSRRAVQDLAAMGLIRERGWHTGPGTVWIPTAEGERLHAGLANGHDDTDDIPVA